MRLLSDNPLRKECQDADECFNLEGRLRVLIDSLKDPELDTPFSVMVSGSWGTGKTSAMRWLSKTLGGKHEDLHIDTCWFYPWKYQNKEDVWKGLIAEVIIATIDFENVDPRKVMKAVKQFGKFLGAGFIRIVSSIKPKIETQIGGQKAEVELDLKDAFEGITEEYAKHVTPQDAYYNAFEETFKRWIAESYGKEKRLIVFIDDLDRCMPDIALQVLEALKLYLNVENLVFVVGVDKEVIDRIVHKRYCDMFGKKLNDEETQRKAGQYLDKMFQVEVDVQPSDELVENYRSLHLSQMQWWLHIEGKNREYFTEVLRKQSGLTPRSVIRTINAALTRVGNAGDPELVTKAVWQALIELVLRQTKAHREAWRVSEGRAFFEAWRKDVHQRRKVNPNARAFLPIPSSQMAKGDTCLNIDLMGELGLEHDEQPEAFVTLKEERFRPFWPLLTDSALGILASIQLKEDDASQRASYTTNRIELRFSKVISFGLGIAEADLTESLISSLTRLDLTESPVDDEVVNLAVERLHALKHLDLRKTPITDAGIKRIEQLTELEALYLSDTCVTDESLRGISTLTNLQRLSLSNTAITDTGVRALSRLPRLHALFLRDTLVSDIGVQSVSGVARLSYLDLKRSKITDGGIDSISRLERLEYLDLGSTFVTDQGLRRISEMRSLRYLDLEGSNITDLGVRFLASMSWLEVLGLSRTKITDNALNDLTDMLELHTLSISETGITDIGLNHLARVKKLRNLHLHNVSVSDESVGTLRARKRGLGIFR